MSAMSRKPITDDPRLTAYALGELNAADRAAVEQQIGDSVETLLEIEAIREVAGQLRAALREETVDATDTHQRVQASGAASAPRFALEHIEGLTPPRSPIDVALAPTLASVGRETSPLGKFSGKFALAASCLAMFGAIGIVGLSGRSEKSLALKRDLSGGTLAWYDADQNGNGVLELEPSFSDGLSNRRAIVVLGDGHATVDGPDFIEAGGGVAPSSTPGIGGLGGFDIRAIGAGPAVRVSGGTSVGSSEGFGGRGSGSRQSMLASGGGTKNSKELAAEKAIKQFGSIRAKQSSTNLSLSQKAPVTTLPQDAASQRLSFGVGVIEGGRGLPPVAARTEAEGVDRYQIAKQQRDLSESLAKLRGEQLGEVTVLDGEVLEAKQSTPNGHQVLEISVGTDDGVAVGDNLDVVRKEVGKNPRYLGSVRVIHVTPDRSVAQVMRRTKINLFAKGDRIVRLTPEAPAPESPSAEAYAAIHDNPFASPLAEPLSTFSIDVDTAAYSNMRRFLTQGSCPPVDSVRIEELVNYFSYDYTPPNQLERQIAGGRNVPEPADQPFAVHMEVAGCPWNADHRLVRVGLKGKEIALDKRPVSNLVFLIDVSGSMQPENKLPLVKQGIRRLVDQLGENDRVGIVVYAGASGLALDSTNATQKDVILSAIENLQAGGSTNGGEGIQLAYALARKHFIQKGTNRVILCTDGDFNVGITDQNDLTRLIEEESKSGVFLSVLGFGMGNLKDSTLEKLADKGNGNYAYIDTLREANKVFVEQMTGTLITIAKDVKIQIEFNPAQVGAYRLIGYENRVMAAQDFHDDTKDAGEIGAGHTVTALYEIIPPSKLPAQPKEPVAEEEKLKYQPNVKSPAQNRNPPINFTRPVDGNKPAPAAEKKLDTAFPTAPNSLTEQGSSKPQPNGKGTRELLTIKLRYKQPDADKSQLIEQPLIDDGKAFAQASTDFRFAASVASFGMILRHSPHRGNTTLDAVAEIAQSSLGADKSGYRSEFVGLVRSAKALSK
jgi:Ca-activated chloride channel family protein